LHAGDTVRRHENRAVPRPLKRHARLTFPGTDGVSTQFRNKNAGRVEAGVQTIHLEDAVARIPEGRATLLERSPGIPASRIVAATELVLAGDVPEMCL
jgi:hypothetical protein